MVVCSTSMSRKEHSCREPAFTHQIAGDEDEGAHPWNEPLNRELGQMPGLHTSLLLRWGCPSYPGLGTTELRCAIPVLTTCRSGKTSGPPDSTRGISCTSNPRQRPSAPPSQLVRSSAFRFCPVRASAMTWDISSGLAV